MVVYVALLRAVNVGGTGKLPMSELKAMADALGYRRARTYIASGNLLFAADASEAEVKAALEAKLAAYAGKPLGLVIRTAAELAQIPAANPFSDAPPNNVAVIFLDEAPSTDGLNAARHRIDEQIALGAREFYVCYGLAGIGRSKLVIPAARNGTARNMNTVAALAAMAAKLA